MNLLTSQEIQNFKKDGAIVIRNKFDVSWIEKLKKGIDRDIKNPSPRFKSHTLETVSYTHLTLPTILLV